jgi:hypothetical protein
MKKSVRVAIYIATLIAFATTAFPIDVKTDYDHHVDFSRYKTYSWAKVDTPDPLWKDRVKEAIDAALAKHGWTQVPEGGDVSVVAIGMTKNRRTLHTFYDGFPGWYWGGFGEATTTVDRYTEGSLVVDMFDSRTKKLIWRGSVSEVLADKPEKNEKKLRNGVEKMFDHFPPSSSKA